MRVFKVGVRWTVDAQEGRKPSMKVRTDLSAGGLVQDAWYQIRKVLEQAQTEANQVVGAGENALMQAAGQVRGLYDSVSRSITNIRSITSGRINSPPSS